MAGVVLPLIAKLAGVLGLGSSVASNMGAKSRQNLANSQNVAFWNKQNAYNTPKAQMARLRDAGLNPALIYGSGATNTGVAGSIAPSKPAPYNIKDPTPTALNAAMLESQLALQSAQARNLNANAKNAEDLNVPKVEGLNLKNEYQAIKNEIAGKTKTEAINIIKQSSLQSEFNTQVKEADATAATAGYIKGNPFYTIFKQLGIEDDSEASLLIRKTLIGSLIGSKILGQLSPLITKFIPKKID
jgi:hypothetical protein